MHFYLFFFCTKTNVWDIVYIQNAGFIRPVMILCVWVFCTRVLWKKNVACTSFPGKYIFMRSIYQDWVYHNLFQSCYAVVQYTFWILIDKMLIGTLRSRTDMSFWQIGPGKKKNMIFIFDPHLEPLPNIRISQMDAGHNQEQPNPLTTLQCHGGGPLGHISALGATRLVHRLSSWPLRASDLTMHATLCLNP